MTSSIRDVMDNEIPVLDCDDTIADAGRILTATGRPSLPVLNPDFSPFGLLSQYDLLNFHQQGGNTLATHAWEICRTRPATLPQDSSVESALQLLADRQLNEVIAIDRAGRFAGLASRARLLEHYIDGHLGVAAGHKADTAVDRFPERSKIRDSRGL